MSSTSWQVSDGRVPERVVAWLERKLKLFTSHYGGVGILWIDKTPLHAFVWPHDREPTIAEALQLLADQEGA